MIGRRLFIDHGSEVHIGETGMIGKAVTVYQGASFVGDASPGRRHAVVVEDVPAGATAVGIAAL